MLLRVELSQEEPLPNLPISQAFTTHTPHRITLHLALRPPFPWLVLPISIFKRDPGASISPVLSYLHHTHPHNALGPLYLALGLLLISRLEVRAWPRHTISLFDVFLLYSPLQTYYLWFETCRHERWVHKATQNGACPGGHFSPVRYRGGIKQPAACLWCWSCMAS